MVELTILDLVVGWGCVKATFTLAGARLPGGVAIIIIIIIIIIPLLFHLHDHGQRQAQEDIGTARRRHPEALSAGMVEGICAQLQGSP